MHPSQRDGIFVENIHPGTFPFQRNDTYEGWQIPFRWNGHPCLLKCYKDFIPLGQARGTMRNLSYSFQVEK